MEETAMAGHWSAFDPQVRSLMGLYKNLIGNQRRPGETDDFGAEDQRIFAAKAQETLKAVPIKDLNEVIDEFCQCAPEQLKSTVAAQILNDIAANLKAKAPAPTDMLAQPKLKPGTVMGGRWRAWDPQVEYLVGFFGNLISNPRRSEDTSDFGAEDQQVFSAKAQEIFEALPRDVLNDVIDDFGSRTKGKQDSQIALQILNGVAARM
jgi:hypothetical protein